MNPNALLTADSCSALSPNGLNEDDLANMTMWRLDSYCTVFRDSIRLLQFRIMLNGRSEFDYLLVLCSLTVPRMRGGSPTLIPRDTVRNSKLTDCEVLFV
jgi:hypothetical protein